MSQCIPEMRKFAKRLIAFERKANINSTSPQVFHVCEKLRPNLAKLMGTAGFRALLSRALSLASSEAVWLRSMSITQTGSLEGLEELEAKLAQDEMVEGEVVLVAHLLALLATFIGEGLMLRLVQDTWPDLNLGNGGRK
jgi:hypothetical protein